MPGNLVTLSDNLQDLLFGYFDPGQSRDGKKCHIEIFVPFRIEEFSTQILIYSVESFGTNCHSMMKSRDYSSYMEVSLCRF